MSSILTPGGAAPSLKVPASAVAELPVGVRLEVQLNFCKNPVCANYGVAPTLPKYARRAKAAAGAAGAEYGISGGGTGTSRSSLTLGCKLCGEFPPIKSNEGIVAELQRIAKDAAPPAPVSCPDPACVNHGRPFSRTRYVGHGTNSQGSRRWRCRACLKTFAVPTRTTTRQREPLKNAVVYRLLVNKSPISRICEVADIAPKTFYDKLDFIHARSVAFAGKFDRALPDLKLDRLYLAVDRQSYILNWSGRKDRRNVMLHGIGTADLDSGYVFGMHLNFDGSLDATVIEADAMDVGDGTKEPPWRKYSWLLLNGDYLANALEANKRAKARSASTTLDESIEAAYSEAAIRDDVENARPVAPGERLPLRGMQVRPEYTMYAHFLWLKVLLRNVGKVRFFMDQESGIRAACLGAFAEEVQDRKCDAFYVRLGKEMSVADKRKAKQAAQERFDAYAAAHPGVSEQDILFAMMKDAIKVATVHGKWSDRWVVHPWPSMVEPEKALCHLTDHGDYDEDHLASLYLRGSLHAIDRYFMLLRRRVSLLERSLATSSKTFRSWHGYSAYNPANVQKALDIFRTYYNFCLKGRDGRTPAMRLGLAERVYTPSEVLSYGSAPEMKKGSGGVRRSPSKGETGPVLSTS